MGQSREFTEQSREFIEQSRGFTEQSRARDYLSCCKLLAIPPKELFVLL